MKNRKISALALVLAAVIVLTQIGQFAPAPVAASSYSELKSQLATLEADKEKIDDKIAELESQLSDNLNEMEAIVAQKNLIDQEVFMIYEQMENINQQIAAYGTLIADKQEELDAAQARLEQLNEKNKERIRAMEEDGTLSYWSVLFKANSFSDLLDRLNMVEEIAASDQRRLKEMSAAAEEVAKAKAELEEGKAALEANKQELIASQATLETKRADADKLLADLVATGAEYEAYLAEQEAEAEKLLNKIEDVEEDIDYLEWLATSKATQPTQGGGTGGAPTNTAGITWLKPCTYRKVSSPYGWRIHPVYGDWRFHSGVDLDASQGSPIYATRSGVVSVATYSSSAGYYVTINHQDGFESKYLHMTHYIVGVGEYVTAGQVIGYVGSTGTSTGPHLHFTICYNGSSVNPSDYINF